jgi:hypothetical protein
MATLPRHPMSHHDRAVLAARTRWGEGPRIVRVSDLTVEQRRLVVALVDAARSQRTGEQTPDTDKAA